MVFTVVFGMGTGVTPYRIATGNIWLFNNVRAGNSTVLQPSRSATCFARRLAPGCVSYISLFVSQSLHASMQSFETKILLHSLQQLDSDANLTHSFRKEVIQPQVLLRLPCYDFTPVIRPAFDGSFFAVRSPASGIPDSHGVTGGVYKTRERIHRDMLIRDY